MQRLVGVGTIKVCSGDKTMGDFEIKNIKRPKATKELLSDLVEKQRDIKRVDNRENMIDGHVFFVVFFLKQKKKKKKMIAILKDFILLVS